MRERTEAAEMLAAKLFEAEATINQAITKTAELIAAMPEACVKAGLSASSGQPAVAEAVGAVAALSEARQRLGESHSSLAALQRKIGLGHVAFGPGQEKPLLGLRALDGDRAA